MSEQSMLDAIKRATHRKRFDNAVPLTGATIGEIRQEYDYLE